MAFATATNPDALKKLLGLPSEAPDLTGYFSQLNTGRDPVHIAGIDQAAAAEDKRQQEQRDAENAAQTEELPDVAAAADKAQAEKLAIAGEPARVTGLSNQAIEREKAANALTLDQQQRKEKADQLMQLLHPSGGGAPVEGSAHDNAAMKMSINAAGDPTFAPNPMPALIQRAHSQLSEAHDQHLEALAEAERLWPGINAAAQEADKGTAPGIGDSLGRWIGAATGIGANKYAGPSDAASLASEMYRYRAHQDTPLSNFVQKASFGNIEQMAGQLPGVRGLATVAGLFKQHQDALNSANPGTPLANVQRLRHLIDSEESATQEMEQH